MKKQNINMEMALIIMKEQIDIKDIVVIMNGQKHIVVE